MINEKEIKLINALRLDSRRSLSSIATELNVPLSTLFDSLNKITRNKIIRNITLLDYSRFGYNIKVHFILDANNKDGMINFILGHNNINTFSRIIDGKYWIEGIFKNMNEMLEFKNKIEEFEPNFLIEHFILDEIKKEGFFIKE